VASGLFLWSLGTGSVERRWVLLAAAAVILIGARGALSIVSQVRQRQGPLQLVGVFAQACLLGGCFLLHLLGLPGALFAGLLCVRELVNLAGTVILAHRHLGYRPQPRLRSAATRLLLRGAMVQGAVVLVQSAYFHADVILVRTLRGEIELGAYAAAFRAVNPLLLLPGALMAPLLAVFAASAARPSSRLPEQTFRAWSLLFGLGGVAGVVGALAAPELLDMLYGGRYTDGPWASTRSFRWLSLSLACVFWTAPLATALLAARRERTLLVIALGGLAVNVAGNLVLIPVMGFEAAALTTAATEGLVLLTTMAAAHRICGVRRMAAGAVTAAWPAALLALVLWILPPGSRLHLATALGGGCLVACMIFFGAPGRALRRAVGDV
jgi:O-antigen/teichoic acid export membrane protein